MRTSLKLATVLGLNTPIGARILATQPSNLIAYWPLGEITGTTADDVSSTNADGAYAGTFTLNQDGIGDGSRSVLLAGGRVDLTAVMTALNTAMGDKSKGTLLAWVKVANVGVWTDATIRGIVHMGADASNRVFINKNNTSNELAFSHRAGATVRTITTTISASNVFSVGLTWDKLADECKAFVNGLQVGATQTGLGIFAGVLSNGFTAIGDSSSLGSQPFSGNESHVGAWNLALTPAEMLRVGVV